MYLTFKYLISVVKYTQSDLACASLPDSAGTLHLFLQLMYNCMCISLVYKHTVFSPLLRIY